MYKLYKIKGFKDVFLNITILLYNIKIGIGYNDIGFPRGGTR